MKVIYKEPGEPAELRDIPNTLEALQEAVGGYIETVRVTSEIIAIVDEEGKRKGAQPNVIGLVGPVVFCGTSGDAFSDIPGDAFLLHQIINRL